MKRLFITSGDGHEGNTVQEILFCSVFLCGLVKRLTSTLIHTYGRFHDCGNFLLERPVSRFKCHLVVSPIIITPEVPGVKPHSDCIHSQTVDWSKVKVIRVIKSMSNDRSIFISKYKNDFS